MKERLSRWVGEYWGVLVVIVFAMAVGEFIVFLMK